jgi:hypothetical protein
MAGSGLKSGIHKKMTMSAVKTAEGAGRAKNPLPAPLWRRRRLISFVADTPVVDRSWLQGYSGPGRCGGGNP